MTKSNLRRNGFISHCNLLVHQRGKPGMELKGKKRCRGHGGMLFTDLTLIPCLTCYLQHSRTTSPWMTPPIGSFSVLHQSLIKKMCDNLAHWSIWWKYFSNLGPLFPTRSSLWQVDTKLANTGCHRP